LRGCCCRGQGGHERGNQPYAKRAAVGAHDLGCARVELTGDPLRQLEPCRESAETQESHGECPNRCPCRLEVPTDAKRLEAVLLHLGLCYDVLNRDPLDAGIEVLAQLGLNP
jgi:hypothetical protein